MAAETVSLVSGKGSSRTAEDELLGEIGTQIKRTTIGGLVALTVKPSGHGPRVQVPASRCWPAARSLMGAAAKFMLTVSVCQCHCVLCCHAPRCWGLHRSPAHCGPACTSQRGACIAYCALALVTNTHAVHSLIACR